MKKSISDMDRREELEQILDTHIKRSIALGFHSKQALEFITNLILSWLDEHYEEKKDGKTIRENDLSR